MLKKRALRAPQALQRLLLVVLALQMGGPVALGIRSSGLPTGGFLNGQVRADPSGRAARNRSASTDKKRRHKGKDEATIAEQKKWAEGVKRTLRTRIHEGESDNFILYTDMPDERQPLLRILERMFNWLSEDVFQIKRDDELWEGKCLVFVFERRSNYEIFAEDVDKRSSARKTHAYFRYRNSRVHVVATFTGLEPAKKQLGSSLIHEMTHAFLEFYKDEGHVNVWLHEGLAQYVEHRAYPELAERKYKHDRLRLMSVQKRLPPLEELFRLEDLEADDIDGYCLSLSVVDSMIRISPRKFARFVDAIKDGKNEEEAIRKAFRMSLPKFEKLWLRHVTTY